MNYYVKVLIFLYIVLELVISRDLSYEELVILLAIIALTILKERYYDSIYLIVVTLLLTGVAVTMNLQFIILIAISVIDFILKGSKIGIAISIIFTLYIFVGNPHILVHLVLITLSCFIAYLVRKGTQEESLFNQILDNERRLRYELEQAKVKLLHSSKEIANIVEVRERNRIARDIHDSIGHSLAGILIQLQAAYKLHSKNEEKSMTMIQKSIDGLADSVELLRNTVHNIKPRGNLDVEYIKSIIDNYKFCKVNLKLSGDFNTIPAIHLEIISTNTKEALTNAARYSKATLIDITIDVNDQYTRLYIKDNGIGSPTINEGLGLSGMRERIRNLGGTISISSNKGFLIVCVLPRHEGGGLFESTNRR